MSIVLKTEPADRPGVTRVTLAIGVDRQSTVEVQSRLFEPGMETALATVLDAITAQSVDPSTVEYGPKREMRRHEQA